MQEYYYLTVDGATRSFFDENEVCELVEHETADHVQSVLNGIKNDDQRESEAQTLWSAHDLILDKIMSREFVKTENDNGLMRLVICGKTWEIVIRAPRTVGELPEDDRIVLVQTDFEVEAVRETFPELGECDYCFVVMGEAEYDACFEILGGGVPWNDKPINEVPRGY